MWSSCVRGRRFWVVFEFGSCGQNPKLRETYIVFDFLVLQRILQVLLTWNWFPILILQPQRKVPHQPHERRKRVYQFLRIIYVSILEQKLSQIRDQSQIFYRFFIDVADAIVDEVGWQKQSHEKDFHIGIFAFLKWTESFRVDDQAVSGDFVVLYFYYLGPNPESFGAGVDGGPHLEAWVFGEKDAIEDVAFAGSVLAGDGDDGELGWLDAIEELDGLWCEDKF